MSDDTYFKMPDDVAKGGVIAAIESGEREVTMETFQWQVCDVLPNLGRADRIHFFVMLCGGGPKIDTDRIEDVQFEIDDSTLSAAVTIDGKVRHVNLPVIYQEWRGAV